ncbi:MAG: proline--tRNA ligase [Nanobdellota archaeon]
MAETDAKINVKKEEDFSEWFTQLMKKAELADVRYNIKGFPVYMPWATQSIRKITRMWEEELEKNNHEPVIFPILIPEANFHKEANHIEGFTPEVFWVTHGGKKKFEERYAIRPTSETAFYEMFAHWIESYKDLPFKRYQSSNVCRYETKMTRPFLRTREFHWIETHCAFATKEDGLKQVKEDMETTEKLLHQKMALPHIFFKRPNWDTFPGAENTFGADVLLPSGKVLQLPSTHLIAQGFPKSFGISFVDKDEKEKTPWTTCYGPCHSRNYGALITFHGDNQGLKLPWDVAPKQIVIVPLLFKGKEKSVLDKAKDIKNKLSDYSVILDDRKDATPGFKFNEWEMKGVPVRIEIGPRDLDKGEVIIFRRDTSNKESIKIEDIEKYVENISKTFTKNMIEEADRIFDSNLKDCNTADEIKNALANGFVARTCLCSIDKDGESCAENIEKELYGEVRGERFDKDEKVFSKCPICQEEGKHVVYIAKSH